MGITLNLADLKSRAIRIKSVGEAGLRTIKSNSYYDENNDENGLVSIYDGINKFGNSLMWGSINAIGSFLNWSATGIVQWCTSKGLFLLNFNWNITDKELDDKIKAGEIAISTAKGNLAGTALGFAVCGLIPTATIAVFNEALALHVLAKLGEEAAEEIVSGLVQLLNVQIAQWERQAFTSIFKNFRGLLRDSAKGFAEQLVKIGVIDQESLDKMDKNRNEPWSFAGATEESIERIPDPVERAYAEEFWESFQEACIESGFIVASGIDSYYAMQRMANRDLLGNEEIVEIIPDREADDRLAPVPIQE